MTTGVCGEEWWIAAEFWRMSRLMSRRQFESALARLLQAGQPKRKRKARRKQK